MNFIPFFGFSTWKNLYYNINKFKHLPNKSNKISNCLSKKFLENFTLVQWFAFFWKIEVVIKIFKIFEGFLRKKFKKLLKKLLKTIRLLNDKTHIKIEGSFFFGEYSFHLHSFSFFKFYSEPIENNSKFLILFLFKNKFEKILKNVIICSSCKKIHVKNELWNLGLLSFFEKFSKNFKSLKIVFCHFCLFCKTKTISFHKNYWESTYQRNKNLFEFLMAFQEKKNFRFFNFFICLKKSKTLNFFFPKKFEKKENFFSKFFDFFFLKKTWPNFPLFGFFDGKTIDKKIFLRDVLTKKLSGQGEVDQFTFEEKRKITWKNKQYNLYSKKNFRIFKKLVLFFLKKTQKKSNFLFHFF